MANKQMAVVVVSVAKISVVNVSDQYHWRAFTKKNEMLPSEVEMLPSEFAILRENLV